jgi:CDGSH-type Zn-finger protein
VSDCTIIAYENGPLLVRGPFELVDENGHDIERYRKTIALCRCGRSRIKPFCDGTHKRIGFKASSGREARLFENGSSNGAGESPPS